MNELSPAQIDGHEPLYLQDILRLEKTDLSHIIFTFDKNIATCNSLDKIKDVISAYKSRLEETHSQNTAKVTNSN